MTYSPSYSPLYSRTVRLFVVLMLAGLLAGCSATDLLGSFLGGGPNVAANAAVGREVVQGVDSDVVITSNSAPRTSIAPEARVGTVDNSTTNNIEIPPWVIGVMLVLAAGGTAGWVDNIVRWIRKK